MTLSAPQLRVLRAIAQGNGESVPGQTVRSLARHGLVEWKDSTYAAWSAAGKFHDDAGHWVLTRAGEEAVKCDNGR